MARQYRITVERKAGNRKHSVETDDLDHARRVMTNLRRAVARGEIVSASLFEASDWPRRPEPRLIDYASKWTVCAITELVNQ